MYGFESHRQHQCMKHASVRIDNMEIPLIGIPTDETKEACDHCHKRVHIQDILLTETSFLCNVCVNATVE